MSKVLFTRLGWKYIPVKNIEYSINWYSQVLGLEFKQKFIDRHFQSSHIAVFHFPKLPKVALLLVETTEENFHYYIREGEKYPIVALNCEDIEYTYERFIEKGVEIVGELVTLGNGEAKYFYFKDPDGNLIEAAWSIWDEG